MEETKSSVAPGHPAGCHCMNCMGNGLCRMCGVGSRYALLRILLALLVVGVVFALGVKVGEFKAEIRGSYGGWDSMRGGRTMIMHGRDNGMMQEDRFYRQVPPTGTPERSMMQQGVPGTQAAPVPPTNK